MSVLSKLLADVVSDNADDVARKAIAGSSDDVGRKLIATHQITPEKLSKAADAGGFVQPSMAIIDPYADSHITTNPNFGDIFLVSSRDAIDPTKGKTIISDRDVYTPKYPYVNKDNMIKDARGNLIPNTAENANRVMNESPDIFTDGGITANPAYIATANIYNNLDDVVSNANRLTSWDKAEGNLSDKFRNATDQIRGILPSSRKNYQGYWDYDNWSDYDTMDDIINNLANGSDIGLPAEYTAPLNEVLDEYTRMPTNMFEAKPRRVVNGNEFYGAYIPSTADQSVVDNLHRLGIDNINTYDTTTPMMEAIDDPQSNGMIDRVVPELRKLVDSGVRGKSPYILGLGGAGVLAGLLGGNSNADSSYA